MTNVIVFLDKCHIFSKKPEILALGIVGGNRSRARVLLAGARFSLCLFRPGQADPDRDAGLPDLRDAPGGLARRSRSLRLLPGRRRPLDRARTAETLGDEYGALGVGLGKKGDKLLAAVAADQIAVADSLLYGSGDGLQCPQLERPRVRRADDGLLLSGARDGHRTHHPT